MLLNLFAAVLSPTPLFLAAALGAVFLACAALTTPQARTPLSLLAAVLYPALSAMGRVNHYLVHLCPRTIDRTLHLLDGGLSTNIYLWAQAHRVLSESFGLVYVGLPLSAAFVLAASPDRLRCMGALAVAGLFGVGLYIAFPAVGPAHVADPAALRNCMPSLHLTWALLLLLYSPPQGRRFTGPFALLTAASTLTTGEHYLCDLLAAVPYALAVFSSVNALSRAALPGGFRQVARSQQASPFALLSSSNS